MPSAHDFHLILQPSRRDRLLLAAWVALSWSVGAVWLTSHGWSAWGQASLPPWLSPLVALSVGLPVSAWTWRRAWREAVLIGWRDGRWSLGKIGNRESQLTGSVDPMIDLGHWMLLRCRASDSTLERWVVVDPARTTPNWHALRAAVYRRAQVGAPQT